MRERPSAKGNRKKDDKSVHESAKELPIRIKMRNR